jgi:hypothetical protein
VSSDQNSDQPSSKSSGKSGERCVASSSEIEGLAWFPGGSGSARRDSTA